MFCIQITDNGLRHLERLSIQNLNLNYCLRITDAALPYLERLPLQSLKLFQCNVTHTVIARLKKLPSLLDQEIVYYDPLDDFFPHGAQESKIHII